MSQSLATLPLLVVFCHHQWIQLFESVSRGLKSALLLQRSIYTPFLKYPVLHEFKEKHGVALGLSYKNRDSAFHFVHYIAKSQRQVFHLDLSHVTSTVHWSADKGRLRVSCLWSPYAKQMIHCWK